VTSDFSEKIYSWYASERPTEDERLKKMKVVLKHEDITNKKEE
jgi:hypothetical protein